MQSHTFHSAYSGVFSKTCTLITLILMVHCVAAFAGIKEYRYRQILKNQNPGLSAWSSPPVFSSLDEQTEFKKNTIEGSYDQILDHSAELIGDQSTGKTKFEQRTFKQRYFTNSYFAGGQNAPSNSPILYVICGEGSCDGGDFYGEVLVHAQKYKARLVALEHRFYGTSQPFDQLTLENLRYLRTDFALADLAHFQDYISIQNQWTGRWVAIGGSYSGSLAAYYRLTHPDQVVGALASSAPVEAKTSFEEYDADVTATAGPQCAQAIRNVIKQVQDTFKDPAQLAQMKKQFNAEAVQNNIDFIYTLADMAAIAIQYGKKDEFCTAVLGSDPVAGYAKAGKAMFDWFGVTALQDSFQGAEATLASNYTQGVGGRQWLWQTCTEYGYFQVANSDPTRSVRSSLIDLNFHYEMCSHLFGLSHHVNPDGINETYYLRLLDSSVNSSVNPSFGKSKDFENSKGASQIFFTNGSTDPWQFLSISQERGNNTNPLFNYFTIEGGSHCSDFGSSTNPSVVKAQGEFQTLLGQWFSGH